MNIAEQRLRVGVPAPLATVNDVEVLQREIKLSSKLLDADFEITFRERCELVEERLD